MSGWSAPERSSDACNAPCHHPSAWGHRLWDSAKRPRAVNGQVQSSPSIWSVQWAACSRWGRAVRVRFWSSKVGVWGTVLATATRVFKNARCNPSPSSRPWHWSRKYRRTNGCNPYSPGPSRVTQLNRTNPSSRQSSSSSPSTSGKQYSTNSQGIAPVPKQPNNTANRRWSSSNSSQLNANAAATPRSACTVRGTFVNARTSNPFSPKRPNILANDQSTFRPKNAPTNSIPNGNRPNRSTNASARSRSRSNRSHPIRPANSANAAPSSNTCKNKQFCSGNNSRSRVVTTTRNRRSLGKNGLTCVSKSTTSSTITNTSPTGQRDQQNCACSCSDVNRAKSSKSPATKNHCRANPTNSDTNRSPANQITPPPNASNRDRPNCTANSVFPTPPIPTTPAIATIPRAANFSSNAVKSPSRPTKRSRSIPRSPKLFSCPTRGVRGCDPKLLTTVPIVPVPSSLMMTPCCSTVFFPATLSPLPVWVWLISDF